jgi:hypothetical protein
MAFEKSPDEIGVLFKKESKGGKTYYTGTLNGQEVVGFPRTSANGSERIELKASKPRDGQGESVPSYDEVARGEAPF